MVEKKEKKPTLINVIVGLFALLVGVWTTFSCLVLMIVGDRLDVFGLISGPLMCLSGYQVLTGKAKKKAKKKAAEDPEPAQSVRSFSFRADHHEHIVPTWLFTQRQLEQLNTLMGAGLYTREQYLEAKAKILRA